MIKKIYREQYLKAQNYDANRITTGGLVYSHTSGQLN